MERKDFIKIIRLRSIWKIDHRKGDYTLPNGKRLSSYVERLVESQMALDNLKIRKNGNLAPAELVDIHSLKSKTWQMFPMFEPPEICNCDIMERRMHDLVQEIVEG